MKLHWLPVPLALLASVVLAYGDAGHGVFGLPVALASPKYRYLGSLGGTPAGNQVARVNSWPKVLAFLHKVFGDLALRFNVFSLWARAFVRQSR